MFNRNIYIYIYCVCNNKPPLHEGWECRIWLLGKALVSHCTGARHTARSCSGGKALVSHCTGHSQKLQWREGSS